MKSKNICKFISDSPSDKIEIYCFIYEANEEIIKSSNKLQHDSIFLVKNGKGCFKFNDSAIDFCPGSLIFGFKDEAYTVESNDKCEYMYISFSGNRSQSLMHRFGISEYSRVFSGFDGLIPLWYDSLSRASQLNIDLTAEGILLYTFSRLNGITTKQNNLINQIIELSEEKFSDSELSLTSLSEELGYNTKYLSHFFKEKMGVGYSEYLRNIRIKYAVSLLEHGIDSVKNVALLSGYSDPLYFSTVFKKSTGLSPKEYVSKNAIGTP